MKKKDELADLRSKDISQLQEELARVEKEILGLKFRKAVSQIPDTSLVKKLRRKIARIQTVNVERASVQQ